MNASALVAEFNRWQMRALVVGTAAALLSVIGAFFNHAQFFHSYLFAWLFWSGLSCGALVIVMMQALTGGKWGAAVRNLSIAAFMTLPLMALLLVPILFGVHQIYSWSLGILAESGGNHHKQQWLNLPFFIARSVFYFAVLIALAFLVRRALHRARAHNLTTLSAGGLISYVLCMNFASTDWVMSLDPQWYSTIFVIVFMAGQFLAALALVTGLLAWLFRSGGFPAAEEALGKPPLQKIFHDLGNMLLAFVVFWTYVGFSQFLIIWSGNLPKEISWYLERSRGGWQWLSLALVIGLFLLPFALLLSRAAKRDKERLGWICLCILAANVLNNFWLVAPSFHPAGIYVHWLDATELIALGGFWFALFFHFLKQRPLLPAELMEVSENG
jgi:hypothetical protein